MNAMNRENPKIRYSLSAAVASLVALLLLLPLAIAPQLKLWRGLGLVPEMIALLLAGLVLAQQTAWQRRAVPAWLLRPGPHVPVPFLLPWGAASWVRSP